MLLPNDYSIEYISLFLFINEISIIRFSFSSGSCSNVLNPPDTKKVLQNLTSVTDNVVRHLVLHESYRTYTQYLPV